MEQCEEENSSTVYWEDIPKNDSFNFTIIHIFLITGNLEVFNDHVGPNNHFHVNAKKILFSWTTPQNESGSKRFERFNYLK